MTITLVSAATRTVAAPQSHRVPLAARAAAQHAGRIPAALDRVTTAAANVPSASAFQSSL